jgi:uncharacterized protein YpmS
MALQVKKIETKENKENVLFFFFFFLLVFFFCRLFYFASFFFQCSSAQARLRAKFKHIIRRSVKTKTNQDSLSNGE